MKLLIAIEEKFAVLAARASIATGSVWTFALAIMVILGWAALGPLLHYSETWQLVINTGTTIVTFLMVFIIQHAQNKDMRAVQLKLNELIAATEGTSNRLIDVEDMSDDELGRLYRRYQRLAEHAKRLAPGAHTSVEDEADSEGRELGKGKDETGSALDEKSGERRE